MTLPAARIWVIDVADNVGTVVGADLDAPSALALIGAASGVMQVRQCVPHGHKVALRAMAKGTDIVKYGVRIGRLTAAVEAGHHVHTHNLESLRGRGDLMAPEGTASPQTD